MAIWQPKTSLCPSRWLHLCTPMVAFVNFAIGLQLSTTVDFHTAVNPRPLSVANLQLIVPPCGKQVKKQSALVFWVSAPLFIRHTRIINFSLLPCSSGGGGDMEGASNDLPNVATFMFWLPFDPHYLHLFVEQSPLTTIVTKNSTPKSKFVIESNLFCPCKLPRQNYFVATHIL